MSDGHARNERSPPPEPRAALTPDPGGCATGLVSPLQPLPAGMCHIDSF